MSSQRSFAARAFLAVALMIGFYVLAIVIAAALLYIPYAEIRYAGRIHIKLAIIAVVSAGLVLWSIMPRIDRFPDPGPQLEPQNQKPLFDLIRKISSRTGVEMPREVFLVPEVNAWVAQRGGIMGIGSRRVMGLGLPLLEGLTVSELEAVLCHELGHFHGGDTSLGPWIYKTRSAIGRTLANLGNEGFIHKPFEWYGNFFMRVTQAISRSQELAADRLAATISGPEALAGGLRAVHRLAPAYDGYWSSEVVPLLQRGYLPPISGGFSAFVSSSHISGKLEDLMQKEMEESEMDPWDSHPPLAERLAALSSMPQPAKIENDERSALALLTDTLSLEKQMMVMTFGEEQVALLRPVEWSRMTESVWVPEWRSEATAAADPIGDLTVDQLPDLIGSITPFVRKLGLDDVAAEHRVDVAYYMIGCALATLLYDDGWSVRVLPGEQIVFRRNDEELDPFSVMQNLWSKAITAEQWSETCDRLRLRGRALRPAEKSAASTDAPNPQREDTSTAEI